MKAMRKTIVLAALAAATGLGLLAAPVTEAVAQSYPSYCFNALKATSFYRSISTAGSTTTVTFYMIVQNVSGRPLSYAPTVSDGRLSNRPTGTVFTSVARNATSLANLGQQIATNSSGAGALNSNDIIPAVRVVCR